MGLMTPLHLVTENYRGRLQETLDRRISLDDANHDLLSDEYEEDIKA